MKANIESYKYILKAFRRSPQYYKTDRGVERGIKENIKRGFSPIMVLSIVGVVSNILDYIIVQNKMQKEEQR